MNIKENIKEKAQKVKEKAIAVKDETVEFINEHTYLVIPILSGIGMVVSGIISTAGSQTERRREDCSVEDDVTGLKFMTNRPLSNSDILELGDRMIDGQTKGDALNEMGLLKKEKRR
jgi:hypothetical protein